MTVDPEADDFELPESEVATLQAELDTYMQGYEFGVRQTRGERTTKNPLDRKIASIATKMLRKAIIAADKKVADYTDEQFDAMLEALINGPKGESIKAEAERQLAAEKATADVSLSDLLA